MLNEVEMGKLIIFNFLLIAIIAVGLWLVKRYVKTVRAQNIILVAAAIFTIIFHYSSFLVKLLTGGDAIEYLSQTPNLLLPIYPCNLVMWSALVFALLRNKESKLGAFLTDYLFWFGIISTLVGMFANVDFINNPTLADYDNIKSIGAHATLLFNILLLPIFGYVKVDVKRNMINIMLSICEMAIVGGYCNLIFWTVASWEAAYDVNSMFLIHSPFDGVAFLTYPIIVLIAIPIYFAVFIICDMCVHKKGARFFDKLKP